MERIRLNAYIYFYIIFIAAVFVIPSSYAAENNTLAEIKERGVLLWGSDAEGGAPYEFFDPDDPSELIGFEVDIIKELSKRLDVTEQMVQNEWDTLVPALNRKNYDIAIAGIELTETRKQEVNFTRPYYLYSQQIVVRQTENNITKPEDLPGKRVGSLNGSAALRLLEKMPGVEIVSYPSVVGSYKDLENGRLDAVLLDVPIAIFYAKPNPALKPVGEPFGEGYYAIAVRKEDSQLLNRLNEVIGDMIESGQMETILKKWEIWTPAQAKLDSYNAESTENIPQDAVGSQGAEQTSGTLANLDKYLPILLKGAVVTIQITVLSMIFAVILGLSLAIIRMYAPQPFRFLAAAYVEVFRGTPLLIQLYIIYYGLPTLGIKLDAYTAAVLGLALNYAAYEAENYRAGIRSIPKGQMEAAMALGMTKSMALRKVIIPQAVKVVIPPVTNDFIAMFKDSSIVSVITMVELTKSYSYLASANFDYIGLGLITAGIYFMMSYPASIFARHIERRLYSEPR